MSEPAVSTPAAAAAGAATKQPLDEVMLAMEVVDTLRRRQRLVDAELDTEGREADLKERLRKIYAAQGIEVPDHVIDEGVAALKEERFVYHPPAPGLKTRLARLYVNRDRWGKGVLLGLGLLVLAGIANYFVFVAPKAALPKGLEGVHAEVVALARVDEARQAADRQLNAGQAALRDGNTKAAKDALRALTELRTRLQQEYSLRILNRPGEKSGVWRVPDVNTNARNYYIIVEAIDADGRVLTVPIKNEETGKTEPVDKWGLRVDQATFNAVARDKQDDGIIQKNQFGRKRRGELTPQYEMATTGAAITQW